jgi:1-deoxy-D-xylulose-5-phosphate synthase
VKPVDVSMIVQAVEIGFVVTLEENATMGGFGSAVLEAANTAGVSTDRIQVAAIPDSFVEHGERVELLADLQLDAAGLRQRVLAMADDVAAVEA